MNPTYSEIRDRPEVATMAPEQNGRPRAATLLNLASALCAVTTFAVVVGASGPKLPIGLGH